MLAKALLAAALVMVAMLVQADGCGRVPGAAPMGVVAPVRARHGSVPPAGSRVHTRVLFHSGHFLRRQHPAFFGVEDGARTTEIVSVPG
jgi:hypothetical protein